MKSESLKKGLCVWCGEPLRDEHGIRIGKELIYRMQDTEGKTTEFHSGCGDGEVPPSEQEREKIPTLKQKVKKDLEEHGLMADKSKKTPKNKTDRKPGRPKKKQDVSDEAVRHLTLAAKNLVKIKNYLNEVDKLRKAKKESSKGFDNKIDVVDAKIRAIRDIDENQTVMDLA